MTDAPNPTDPDAVAPAIANLETIVSLSKRRGFVFPSSEIYGGINAVWDYGPLGVELKNNVKRAWWRSMVQEREDIVGLDAGILMHPQVWVTSGHVGSFSDPLVECGNCGRRYRLDELPGAEGLSATELMDPRSWLASTSPARSRRARARPPRRFNLMFQCTWARSRTTRRSSTSGPRRPRGRTSTSRTSSRARARRSRSGSPRSASRSETRSSRQLRLPDARVRADGDAVLRPAGCRRGCLRGVAAEAAGVVRALRRHARAAPLPRARPGRAGALRQEGDRRRVPLPVRLEGARGRPQPRRLRPGTHARASGENLEYFDPATEEHFIPWVVETAAGADRAAFTFLIDAYREEEVRGEKRVVLGFHPEMAPYKVAVLPLLKKRPEIVEICRRLRADLAKDMMAVYDDTAAIGKLYRRQDEIGTPWCVTVDVDSLDDGAVTVRDRDSMTQERVPLEGVKRLILDRLAAARA